MDKNHFVLFNNIDILIYPINITTFIKFLIYIFIINQYLVNILTFIKFLVNNIIFN